MRKQSQDHSWTTGPLGEEGIKDALHERTGKSLDYDEVYIEMRRDKGYGDVAAERKRKRKGKQPLCLEKDSKEAVEDTEVLMDAKTGTSALQKNLQTKPTNSRILESEYVQELQRKIATVEVVAAMASNHVGDQVPLECATPSTQQGRVSENTIRSDIIQNFEVQTEGLSMQETGRASRRKSSRHQRQ